MHNLIPSSLCKISQNSSQNFYLRQKPIPTVAFGFSSDSSHAQSACTSLLMIFACSENTATPCRFFLCAYHTLYTLHSSQPHLITIKPHLKHKNLSTSYKPTLLIQSQSRRITFTNHHNNPVKAALFCRTFNML